jgi:hypothetical protein
MIEETPFIFPGLGVTLRYIIDTDSKRLVRSKEGSSAETSPSLLSPLNCYSQQPTDDALPGAASVSHIKLENGSNHGCLVTTCALVESPSVLSVALSWKQNALESPAIVELDTQNLQPVAIRAFELDAPNSMAVEGAVGKFKLVLVGSNGTIVSLIMDEHLTVDTSDPLKVLSSKDYMQVALLEQVGNAELQPNMVSFLSSNHVIVALAPFILTIDLRDGKAEAWSETQCLEDMKSRANFLKGLFGRVLGRMEGGVVDMPPTAALCISTNSVEPTHSEDEDATVSLVFTLHSDASVRKWRIDLETSLLPIELTLLTEDTVHNKLALPSTWSDTNKSVALCARFYEGMFALAVHIRTNTLSSYDQGVSDCNLWVFHGHETEQPAISCHVLKVPDDAVSMVGMCFVPNQRRCTLSATFEVFCHPDSGRSASQVSATVLLVKYPPSLMSIVALEPEIIEMVGLDQIATKERDRTQALSFGSTFLMEDTQATVEKGNANQISQVLHKLDALYLKTLFRPIFPRGNGTVLPPSDACIRRALSKLVHGATKERGMSVELETIKALYEWRSRDKSKSTATTLSPTKWSMQRRKPASSNNSITPLADGAGPQALSVYDSFVGPDESEEGIQIDIVDRMEEEVQFEEELAKEIEAHENRWRRLLYQIWEEEHILRTPVCVFSLESHPIQLLIRGGVTSILSDKVPSRPSNEQPWATVLDEAARHLLRLIEGNQRKSMALHAIEERVIVQVSRAQLAISPKISISEELTSLGRWARLQDDDSDDGKLKRIINEVPVVDLVAWVEAKLPGTGNLVAQLAPYSHGARRKEVSCQLRHAACSGAIRAIDHLRCSRLGKCLLLLEVTAGSHATTAAFRAYLESIALMWTSGQRVKIPGTCFPSSVERKRTSDNTENEPPSTLYANRGTASSSPTMSTLIDALMIEILQSMSESLDSPSSPCTLVVHMVESFLDRLFLPKGGMQTSLLPELGILPCHREDIKSTAYPELALRLLAPFVAFPIPEDSSETVVVRKETLAGFLLHSCHSSKSFSTAEKSRMREIACDLLAPKSPDHASDVDKEIIRMAANALHAVRDRYPPGSVDDMKKQMHRILQGSTSLEIGRLCDMRSARTMFMSLAGIPNSEFDETTRTAIKLLAEIMLNMSRVLHRLTILEAYIARRTDDDVHGDSYNSHSLLAIIADAISEMENAFPPELLREMPEYTSLWSKKFQHSVLAGQWRDAYDACIWNPLVVHRETNFKHLIHAMVNCGALSDLLVMCTELGTRTSMHDGLESQPVDLYEISAEVLLSYAQSSDLYDQRAASSRKSSSAPDYLGALYALHASQEQWRRAAQSLDLKYLNAEKALRRPMGNTNSVNIQTAELRDGLIVEDLVLASCGSANAIELVKNPAHRFIVSGEYGPYSVIPIDESNGNVSASSRSRGRFQNSAGSAFDRNFQKEDRLSKFMSQLEFEGRAVRSIAIRALFFDRSIAHSLAKTAFQREFGSSNQDIKELFSAGYFQHGLLLARSWSKAFESKTGSTKPRGQDLFGSCVAQMGYNLVTLSRMKGECSSRPTLQQLHIAIDTVGSTHDNASYVVTDRCFNLSSLEQADFSAATLLLIRNLTLSYTTAEIPVAVDIGKFFLDEGGTECLPIWLERLLMGADAQPSQNGLFALRRTAGSNFYLGDPAALLTMYIERGMLLDACNVVTSVLRGFGRTDLRAAKAPNRLPENGDIDFVPYQSIDMLWNVIEIAVSKGVYNNVEMEEILNSRARMEEALKKHFEYMKISEMGMRSARLLHA